MRELFIEVVKENNFIFVALFFTISMFIIGAILKIIERIVD